MSKDDITAVSLNRCAVCGAGLEKRVTELECDAKLEDRFVNLEQHAVLVRQACENLFEQIKVLNKKIDEKR